MAKRKLIKCPGCRFRGGPVAIKAHYHAHPSHQSQRSLQRLKFVRLRKMAQAAHDKATRDANDAATSRNLAAHIQDVTSITFCPHCGNRVDIYNIAGKYAERINHES